MISACPNCHAPKEPRHYLCRGCWPGLTPETRRRLWKSDRLARQRLAELHEQLDRGVPLAQIKVAA